MEVPATELLPPKPVDPKPTSSEAPEFVKPSKETSSTSAPLSSTEQTAEPLGHIFITDPPVEPPQTAGKWPPEPPTDSPLNQVDSDNET